MIPDGWSVKEGKLNRVYKFDSSIELAGFLTKLLILSEKVNHHPSCSFCYKTLEIDLWTHSEGTITEKDYQLAAMINQI